MEDWKSIRKRKLDTESEEKSTTPKQQKTDEIIILNDSPEDSEPENDLNQNNLPVCSYGSDCYRKNEAHLANFYHSKAATSKNKANISINADVVNSGGRGEQNFIQYTKINNVRDSKVINKKNSLSLNGNYLFLGLLKNP